MSPVSRQELIFYYDAVQSESGYSDAFKIEFLSIEGADKKSFSSSASSVTRNDSMKERIDSEG